MGEAGSKTLLSKGTSTVITAGSGRNIKAAENRKELITEKEKC